MSSWCDEVEQGMHSVISESWVTLDARFFGQDVIILSFKVAYNLGEAAAKRVSYMKRQLRRCSRNGNTNLASLSIWSPNPGVSTIVRDMRVPSSSSSSSM